MQNITVTKMLLASNAETQQPHNVAMKLLLTA